MLFYIEYSVFCDVLGRKCYNGTLAGRFYTKFSNESNFLFRNIKPNGNKIAHCIPFTFIALLQQLV